MSQDLPLLEQATALLTGRGAPAAPQEGARLVQRAADAGDTSAMQLMAVLTALGVGRPRNWHEALGYVSKAAAAGDERARGQLAVLGDEASFDPAAWLSAPSAKQHFDAPRVLTIENFISPQACAWIMDQARPRLDAARVKNPERGGANVDGIRSNTGMGFSVVDTDLVMQLVQARIAAVIGAPVLFQEPTNILHYTVGQQYRPHFDFLDPGEAHFARELQQIGQRTTTFLIYLNDDFDGGETEFLRLNWRFKGKAGDALVFWNVDADGRVDRNSLHAGLPPTRGEKWLFSKWVRDRPLPLL